MGKVQWSNIKPFIAFFISILILVIGVLLSQEPEATASSHGILQLIASFFGISSSKPTDALLQATNVSTIFYGIIFYLMEGRSSWRSGLTLAVLFVIYFWNYTIKFTVNDGTRFYLFSEYGISMSLLAYYAVVDYVRSKGEDEAEAALSAFSAFYGSIPALLCLALALGLQLWFIAPHAPKAGPGYLAGVATMVLFLSNLVFALVALPWYGGALGFTSGSGRVARSGAT